MVIPSWRTVLIALLLCGAIPVTTLQAQTTPTDATAPESPAAEQKGPNDALNRGTPRGSITGFLDACADFDYQRAAEYLDLRNLPRSISEVGGVELARQLNHQTHVQ